MICYYCFCYLSKYFSYYPNMCIFFIINFSYYLFVGFLESICKILGEGAKYINFKAKIKIIFVNIYIYIFFQRWRGSPLSPWVVPSLNMINHIYIYIYHTKAVALIQQPKKKKKEKNSNSLMLMSESPNCLVKGKRKSRKSNTTATWKKRQSSLRRVVIGS